MLIWLLPPVNVKQTRPIKESSYTPLPHLPKKQYPRTKSYGSRRIFSGGWESKIFYYDSFSQSKDLFSFFFSLILSPKVAVATAVKLKRRLVPTTPLQPLLPLFYKFECILGPWVPPWLLQAGKSLHNHHWPAGATAGRFLTLVGCLITWSLRSLAGDWRMIFSHSHWLALSFVFHSHWLAYHLYLTLIGWRIICFSLSLAGVPYHLFLNFIGWGIICSSLSLAGISFVPHSHWFAYNLFLTLIGWRILCSSLSLAIICSSLSLAIIFSSLSLGGVSFVPHSHWLAFYLFLALIG